MPPAHTAEGDAFALVMIAVLFSALAIIGLILFSILRNASRRNREVEDLLEEVEQDETRKEKAPVSSAKEPWEKDGDWWKKD